MTESSRTILTWILGVGIVVAGGKVVYDLVKAPPPPAAETAKSDDTSASASASASGDVDELGLPIPRPAPAGSAATPPPSESPSGSASAMASGSASAGATAGQLPELLAAIAKDPKGHEPAKVARSPEGLILLIYQIPGLDQAILAIVPNDADAWLWQVETDAPIEQITGAKKTEKTTSPRPGATAVKIIGGPFDGSVGITAAERPKLRVIKSPGFQQLENEQMQQQQQQPQKGGGAPGGAGSTKHGF